MVEEEEEEKADDIVQCGICLDDLGSKKPGLPSGGVKGAYFLPCAHIFHNGCIATHFATQAKKKDSQRQAYRHASGKWCPVCKRVLPDSYGEDDTVEILEPVEEPVVEPVVEPMEEPVVEPMEEPEEESEIEPVDFSVAELPPLQVPVVPADISTSTQATAGSSARRGRRPAVPKVPAGPRVGVQREKDKRGQGFSLNETENLLDLVERLLPISYRDWEGLAQAHSVSYPEHRRTGDSCRRKFQALANKAPGTGTTRPHPTIARAKELRERIASTNGSNTAEDDVYYLRVRRLHIQYYSYVCDIPKHFLPLANTHTF